MAYYTREPDERVAEEVAKLTWLEMRDLARDLSQRMAEYGDYEFTEEQMADLLAVWAKSCNDAYAERMAEEAAAKK